MASSTFLPVVLLSKACKFDENVLKRHAVIVNVKNNLFLRNKFVE